MDDPTPALPISGAAPPPGATADAALLEECAVQSLALLERNLSPQGVLAASRTAAAEARSYTAFNLRRAVMLERMSAESFDLVLLDVLMPEWMVWRHCAASGATLRCTTFPSS